MKIVNIKNIKDFFITIEFIFCHVVHNCGDIFFSRENIEGLNEVSYEQIYWCKRCSCHTAFKGNGGWVRS